ncbi:hypothetical protein SETIT_5G084600v2 [Setaria italica]|uniref:SIAH-type domain-containing protein n=2 Tax=Setaria italica TaxID=4555 RepID=A0A368R2Q1_SETIT|nr:hypothetical protein SETIT_5G084600v2 [Setaria italica]
MCCGASHMFILLWQALPNPKKCHYCSRESDYNRCHGIEKIIGSIQVPCSNTKYGCSIKTSYYEREDHETTCPHAPCFCPDTGCSFSGSTGMLQEHFIAVHQWPSTKFRYDWCFYANIQEGIRVISGEDKQLFLLNVVSESFGCVISVFCVWPHDTDPKFRCAMSFNYWKNSLYHARSSEFQVPSTTLSDGLPRDCFLFIMPKFYLDEDSKICATEEGFSMKNLRPRCSFSHVILFFLLRDK